MVTFEHTFLVRAPLSDVARFHGETRVLKLLTPPPVFVQLRQVGQLAEGNAAGLTLWFGPLPVRWDAHYSGVDAQRGFTDIQTSGPFKTWRHQHVFSAETADTSRVTDQIVYDHDGGLRGLFTRLFFARPVLRMLFAYRAWVTRRALEKR